MSIKFGVGVQIEDIKAIGDDWRVDGYASTFGNVDLGMDIVQAGSFDRTLSRPRPRTFLKTHDMRLVLGLPQSMKPDKRGLFGQFKISKTTLGEEARQLALDGALNYLSIGYDAVDYEFVENGKYRLLKDIELYEVSMVPLPMNEQAEVTNVKNYLAILGIKADMTLAEKANALSDGLNQLISDTRQLVGGADRSLTQTKRQELTELLEMFSGLDAVRSDLTTVLAAAPTVRASGKRALYELAEHRRRLAYILTP